MKYLLVIDDTTLSHFKISDDGKTIYIIDENLITWAASIKPIMRPLLTVEDGESVYLSNDNIEQLKAYETERITKETIERFNQSFIDTLNTQLPKHIEMKPQPDIKKALPHCDNYIDALIDEALDDLAEIKNEASNTADRLSDELLRGKNENIQSK